MTYQHQRIIFKSFENQKNTLHLFIWDKALYLPFTASFSKLHHIISDCLSAPRTSLSARLSSASPFQWNAGYFIMNEYYVFKSEDMSKSIVTHYMTWTPCHIPQLAWAWSSGEMRGAGRVPKLSPMAFPCLGAKRGGIHCFPLQGSPAPFLEVLLL